MLRILFCIICMFVAGICCLYSTDDSNVQILDEDSFNELVLSTNKIWMVQFYSSDSRACKQLVEDYKKVASICKDIANVGVIDHDKHRSLSQKYGISTFPTMALFSANNKQPKIYKDSKKPSDLVLTILAAIETQIKQEAKKILHDDIDNKVPENPVIELTENNFDKLVLESNDMWMVEFFAPWCGHCKNLAPEWKAAAKKLYGKVKFGALDATEHKDKASEYGIRGYPTIKLFKPDAKYSSSTEDYGGGRAANEIVQWVESKLSEFAPVPEVVQLTSVDTFNTYCKEQILCVIAFLPHILDCGSKCRNGYVNVLTTLTKTFKDRQWGWLWSEGGAQTIFESKLRISDGGYPVAVAISPKKLLYSLFYGSYNVASIEQFLNKFAYNRGTYAKVPDNNIPEIVDVDQWDGKDGILPITDEEDNDNSDKDEL